MGLAERDDELGLLRQRVRDCLRGAASVVLVSGPVACGTTTLLREVSEFAAGEGLRVLTAHCPRARRTSPLYALGQIFEAAPLAPEWAARAEAALEAGRAPARARGEGDEVPTHIVDELAAVLTELAAARPVLITLDDLPYADMTSLRVLLSLIDRLRSAPVMIVLGGSDTPGSTHRTFRAGLLRQPHYQRLAVAPLSPSGVRCMLEQLLGRSAADRWYASAHRVSGGNPLLVRALAEDFQVARKASTAKDDVLPVGDAFREAVLACVRHAPPEVRTTAQAAAVLGEAGTPERLGRMVGTSAETATRHVLALHSAGLLAHVRFRHREAAAAVLGELPAEDQARLQQTAAGVLYRSGEATATVAAHLLAAGRAPEAWALTALEEAAEEAEGQGSPHLAGRFLELAYQECRDDRQRAEFLARLVSTQHWDNPTAAARLMSQLVGSSFVEHVDTHRAPMIAHHLFWSGRPGEAAKVLMSVERAVAPEDARTLAQVRTAQLMLATSWPAAPVVPTAFPTGTPAPYASTDLIRFRSASTLLAILRGGSPDQAARQAEEILRGAWLDTSALGTATLDAAANALLVLVHADRLGTAASWCDRFLAHLAERGDKGGESLFTVVRAEITLRQGDFPAALDQARTALAQVASQYWGMAAGLPLSIALFAATAMGDQATATALARKPMSDALMETRYGLHYLRARGHFHLANQRPAPALEDFMACGRRMTEWDMDLPTLVPWRADAAEAQLALGQRGEAARLLDDQLKRLAPGASRIRGTTLRLLAAVRGPEERVELLEQAARAFRDCGDSRELGKVMAALDRSPATAPRQAPRPAGASGSNGGRVSGLTRAELRVAEFAARGCTNREIASRLGVTASTVEQHLTKVFRKLKLSRRAELPGWFCG